MLSVDLHLGGSRVLTFEYFDTDFGERALSVFMQDLNSPRFRTTMVGDAHTRAQYLLQRFFVWAGFAKVHRQHGAAGQEQVYGCNRHGQEL